MTSSALPLPPPPFSVYFHDSVTGPRRDALRLSLERVMAGAAPEAAAHPYCVSFLDVTVRCIVASAGARRCVCAWGWVSTEHIHMSV